jgi:L-lactate dehydrogenase complex protein LldG
MSDGMELLLERVKKALGNGARPEPAERNYRDLMPPAGGSGEDRIELFAKNVTALSGVFTPSGSFEEAVERLKIMANVMNWKKVACHGEGNAFKAAQALGLEVLNTDGGYEIAGLEKCDAGITLCDALVAQTGSVLVTARTAGGRGLSVLPPHHVVLAETGQLVSDLSEAFEVMEKKYGSNYPSSMSFITGPSRTADIEQTLVLGAHGPKKLTILMF